MKKFKDYEYKRPDIEHVGKEFDVLLEEFDKAGSAAQQYDIILKINELRNSVITMRTISSIRYSIDTKDAFYDAEHEYFDNVSPIFQGYEKKFYKALLDSSFRDELEALTGKELYSDAKLKARTFSDDIIEDKKTENQLVTQYVKLIASARIKFEGKERNIAGMEPFEESTNRDVRKAAYDAKWKFFADHEEEIDRIYDELVKVRTRIAKKLGYENFVQLGYDRMGRTDYTEKEVEKFRESVKDFIVPLTLLLDDMRKKRTGLDDSYFYDLQLNFESGNPTPKGPPEWIVGKARKMYKELSPETEKFFDFLTDAELMDLYNRENKAAGGYCTYIPEHEAPFIFSNMNGTSDDIRVLTHEAGHAFQTYESRGFEMIEYMHPTSDACEIHSMSMEFITWPWMNLFFEEDTDKFLFAHLSKAVKFIPYGVSVDEFQHYVYANPDATPADRKAKWREIEKKYLPFWNYGDNSFLKGGAYWFRQPHIFKSPFYYIDYCLAQICALQFWRKCNHDRDVAWRDYLKLCREGGSKSFLELVEVARLETPFDRNVVESIIHYADEWLTSANPDFYS